MADEVEVKIPRDVYDKIEERIKRHRVQLS